MIDVVLPSAPPLSGQSGFSRIGDIRVFTADELAKAKPHWPGLRPLGGRPLVLSAARTTRSRAVLIQLVVDVAIRPQ